MRAEKRRTGRASLPKYMLNAAFEDDGRNRNRPQQYPIKMAAAVSPKDFSRDCTGDAIDDDEENIGDDSGQTDSFPL